MTQTTEVLALEGIPQVQMDKYLVTIYSGTATVGGGVGEHEVLYALTKGPDANVVTIQAVDDTFQLALEFRDGIPDSRQDFVFGNGAEIVTFQVSGREISGNFTEVKFAPNMETGIIEIYLSNSTTGLGTIIQVKLPTKSEDTDKLA
ncbi:MAG: hypothetical protein ABI758_05295 [Candidatus Woesebacteria bacterium]